MKTLPVLSPWLGSALLTDCVVPSQPIANYGHPTLNQAAAQQTSYQPAPTNVVGRVTAGALLGGLVGSRFGQGNGQVAGAAVGPTAESPVAPQQGAAMLKAVLPASSSAPQAWQTCFDPSLRFPEFS